MGRALGRAYMCLQYYNIMRGPPQKIIVFAQRHDKNKILINIKQYIIHQNLNAIFHLATMIYGRFEHFVSVRIQHACRENWVMELTNRLYTMSHAYNIIYTIQCEIVQLVANVRNDIYLRNRRALYSGMSL